MIHLLILYNFIVLLIGVGATAFTANIVLQAKERVLRYYLVFFVLFSVTIFLRLIDYYLASNLTAAPFAAELVITAAQVTLNMAVILAVIFFFHKSD